MNRESTRRQLAFERLETKFLTSALLLLFAPLDDAVHTAAEQMDVFGSGGDAGLRSSPTPWRYHHSLDELLRFVDEHTGESAVAVGELPSEDQCEAADAMMQLNDRDLRAMVAAETLATTGHAPSGSRQS